MLKYFERLAVRGLNLKKKQKQQQYIKEKKKSLKLAVYVKVILLEDSPLMRLNFKKNNERQNYQK